MARSVGNPVSTKDWQAANIRELREIWANLHPESDDETAERTFRGQVLTAEQAGDVFERWVLEAFRLSGGVGHYSYRVPQEGSGITREEIDGLVFEVGQAYLVECKFWVGKVDFGPLALFHAIVDTRLTGALGLVFSAFGDTLPALESVRMLRPARLLLFQQDDLAWALDSRSFKGRMLEMVRRKWMLTVKSGRPHTVVSEPIELFN
jgi:hypothetical protein